MRGKFERYFKANDTRRYLDVMQDLVKSYNTSYHRSIGMRPVDVTRETQEAVRRRLYPAEPVPREKPLAVGTKVMISTNKRVFSRGFETTFQPQVYEIAERLDTSPLTYRLTDEHSGGGPLRGSFYRQELQPVSENLQTFVVEKVVRWRGRGDRRQALIKWEHYPDSHNSWVPASALFYADADRKKK